METRRPRRVGDLLLREIAGILHKDIKDPRLALVTLTGVEMSADLKVARVFYTVLSEGQEAAARQEAQKGLKSASPFIRRGVARSLRLRTVPEIRFVHDDSIERGFRLLEILKGVQHDSEEPNR